jgi:hypothetical protein
MWITRYGFTLSHYVDDGDTHPDHRCYRTLCDLSMWKGDPPLLTGTPPRCWTCEHLLATRNRERALIPALSIVKTPDTRCFTFEDSER